MSTITRQFALLLLPLAVAACGNAGDPASRITTTRDSAGITIAMNHPGISTDSCTLAAEPLVEIGTVSGAPEYQLFGASDATVLSDGRIAIVNRGSQEIRIYDDAGRFLHSFGREGEGPGEFTNVARIWALKGDTLAVGDWDPWRTLYFLADGTFLGAATPRPLRQNVPKASAVLDDGSFVLATECCFVSPEFSDRTLHVVHFARDASVMDTIGVYPNGRMGFIGPPDLGYFAYRLFEAHTEVAAAGGRIAIGYAAEREITVRSPAGRVYGLIRWTGPDRTVRQQDLDAFEDRIRAMAAEVSSPRGKQFRLARIADNRPVNDSFPAFSRLIFDRSDGLWVRRFTVGQREYSSETGPNRWYVFDSDGAFRCHATTPAGFRIYDIGQKYILGVVRDELDVEYARLYSLRRASGTD